MSFGNDFSNNSSRPAFVSWNATFKIKTLTITAAIGSRIVHLLPNNIAPPIPKVVPIDEKASLR